MSLHENAYLRITFFMLSHSTRAVKSSVDSSHLCKFRPMVKTHSRMWGRRTDQERRFTASNAILAFMSFSVRMQKHSLSSYQSIVLFMMMCWCVHGCVLLLLQIHTEWGGLGKLFEVIFLLAICEELLSLHLAIDVVTVVGI